jgi:hypothetical protein
MRNSLAFVLLASAACGGNGPGTGDDDVITPDGGDDLPPPPERGFRIESPSVELQPGDEKTFCYYFHTPNTEELAINHWKSVMTSGSHHMIMFMTQGDAQPEGTVTEQNCGIGANGSNAGVWTYAAGMEQAELSLPGDDGGGKPLAQEIAAGASGFFQMHYLNATDNPITAHVVVDAFALDAGAAYTQTAAFVTYNGNINIPAGATGHVESQTCSVPTNAKFWEVTTHAHKHMTHASVKDGSELVFETSDWEHPGAMLMDAGPFLTFASGKITYACTYDNPSNQAIRSGESAQTDEMCMATTYYFPATRPMFCYNNLGPF